ncbi:fluoride efflux transporter FluC [Pilimelia anulata]|uniref:fluoride efflux transporter FluC n=1 Tax=Pilimelia anulata TaxID=53371 RepID=UPI001E48F2DC|nr:CrcB family protein [Pilimelia anulata]
MTVLPLVLGGAAGAVLRYLLAALLPPGRLPWATLAANGAASAGLGALTAAGPRLPGWLLLLAATGVCGALSTWSTLGYELFALLRERRVAAALLLGTAHLGLGCGAVLLAAAAAAG